MTEYTHNGPLLNGKLHGECKLYYKNGDYYVGSFRYGRFDGYGEYKHENNIYTGFYSYGRLNGLATAKTANSICKGQWRSGKKHGSFINTNTETRITTKELWEKDLLLSVKLIDYTPPELLQTSKINPKLEAKSKKFFKGVDKKCIICCNFSANSTNTSCGHVAMCFNCLIKCNNCPICRTPITNCIKLYID